MMIQHSIYLTKNVLSSRYIVIVFICMALNFYLYSMTKNCIITLNRHMYLMQIKSFGLTELEVALMK